MDTRRPRQAAGVVALVAALAFAAAGCGGSSSSKTTTSAASELQAWAGGLCTAVGKYKTSVAATIATLHVRKLSRPALQVAVEDLSAARRQLTNDLSDLGAPPIPESAQGKKIISDLGAELRKQGEKIQAVVTNESGTGDVKQAASDIVAALAAAAGAASNAAGELRKLDPKAGVEQAFKSAPSCSSL
jgi:hypothetical protein